MNKLIIFLFTTSFFLPVNTFAIKKITLEDILINKKFTPSTVRGLISMKDGVSYAVMENGNKIVKYNYKDGKQTGIIFDLSKIEDTPIKTFTDYRFCEDESKILITTNIKKIYRHSFTAEYYVWNSVTKELSALSKYGPQQVATFSPDGERIAFVRNNNIFIKSLKFGTENQVTYDGKKNFIINGIPDWVYEEEFSYNKAFSWSPDSKFLAFTRFDESQVRNFPIMMFKGSFPSYEENTLYPSCYNYKYPVAGEKNSIVSIHVYELKSKTSVNVDLGQDSDIYVSRIKWTTDGNDLAVFRLNRRQNHLDVLLANPMTGDSRMFYTEKNQRYINENFPDNFIFLPGNKYFILTSEHDGYSHLYLYNRQGFFVKQITKGTFDVTKFYGYNPSKRLFYYQAAKESPMRREVYYTSLDGKKQGKLSTKEGTNDVIFSTGYKYYINYLTNVNTPNTITIHRYDGKLIRTLEDNKALLNKLADYSLSPKEFFSFKTSAGVSLNGWIIKPSGFDDSKKYPLIMTQYSGPESQSVQDKWSVGWNNYLSQEGFIVACVDPRGTGARGEEFRKMTYMKLGQYESDDQVEAAKYFGTLSYVDKKNIAIWGWSYGGFNALLSLEKGGSIFKAGIAVAPVTSWKFYDTVYTERYMRTPKENPEGYAFCPLAHPENIKSKLLLIHGSGDDNVHVQNSMEFTEAMVQSGIPFDMAIYTNRNHGIYGGNTTLHLYNRMLQFFKENLK
ncbi:MAG: S9 family peptidase [Prolixibacteraceae bacterium]|nr:S9 family peptidase [Prolixibacteraceae bacterium]